MSDRLIDLSDGWQGDKTHQKYLLLVACPLCGEDWRDDYERGEHDHDDVKDHFEEEHDGSEIVVRETIWVSEPGFEPEHGGVEG